MRNVLLCSMPLLFGVGLADAQTADELLEQAVVEAGNAPTDAAVAELLRAERQAEIELAAGAVKLGLLTAKPRLAQGRPAAAIEVAAAALETANERIPASPARDALTKALEDVMAKARTAQMSSTGAEDRVHLTEMGEPQPGSTDRPQSPQQKYFPDRKVFSERDAATRDAERYEYEADQERAIKSDAADALARISEDRRIPSKVLVYPGDWPAITARRERFRDGIIYQGPEFRTEDGEVRRTVVYDIGSLTVDHPYFTDAPQLNLFELTQSLHDREALRLRSEIFTGYASELAAGIPLLYYFGGVGESRVPPSTGEYQRADLMRMVHEVLDAK